MNDKYKNVHYLSILNECNPFFSFIPNYIKEKYMGTEIDFMGWNDTTGFTYLFDNPATGKREYLGFIDAYIFDIRNNNRIMFDTDWINPVATGLDKIDSKLKNKYIDLVDSIHEELRERERKIFTKCFDEQTRKTRRLIASIGLNKYNEVKEIMNSSSSEDASEK